MSILSRSKIASMVTSDVEEFKASLDKGEDVGKILICPFELESLGPTSYDLHIGSDHVFLGRRLKQKHLDEGQKLTIEPGQAVTLVSLEYIGLPSNIAATVFSKVSWLERGLSQISTYVHPGFYGHLTESLMNVSNKRVSLDYGSPFCQIIFNEVPGAKSNERYTGPRRGQTGRNLKRMIEERNPRLSLDGSIDSFIKTGLLTTGILLGSAIYATQAGIWLQNVGWSVSVVLAAFFGGFFIEIFRRRFL